MPCVSVRTSTDIPVGVWAPPLGRSSGDGGRRWPVGRVHKETARADHSGFKTLTSVWNLKKREKKKTPNLRKSTINYLDRLPPVTSSSVTKCPGGDPAAAWWVSRAPTEALPPTGCSRESSRKLTPGPSPAWQTREGTCPRGDEAGLPPGPAGSPQTCSQLRRRPGPCGRGGHCHQPAPRGSRASAPDAEVGGKVMFKGHVQGGPLVA